MQLGYCCWQTSGIVYRGVKGQTFRARFLYDGNKTNKSILKDNVMLAENSWIFMRVNFNYPVGHVSWNQICFWNITWYSDSFTEGLADVKLILHPELSMALSMTFTIQPQHSFIFSVVEKDKQCLYVQSLRKHCLLNLEHLYKAFTCWSCSQETATWKLALKFRLYLRLWHWGLLLTNIK